MKIALIKPPARGLKDQLAYPPLGLLYLASNLKGKHDIKIYNMEDINEPIDYDHDLYGISVHSVSSAKAAGDLTKQIKKHTKVPVAWGGAFPTSMPGYGLAYGADFVLKGEGEKEFSRLVNNLKQYKKRIAEGDRIISCGIITNLDTLQPPARHLLPKEQIRHEGRVHHTNKPSTTIFITRGCPWECYFCQRPLETRKWRCRSVPNAVKEIQQVQQDYDIDWFRFPDDNLTLNKKWFMELCDALRPLDIQWTCLSRADGLTEEMLVKAKEAGLQEVFFGIESGSAWLLQQMNKKTTPQVNTNAIKLCRKVGVKSCAYMMFGFPGENDKTVEETKQWLLEAKPDKSRISTFIPIPMTKVWNEPELFRVTIKRNYEDYWYFDDPESGQLFKFGLNYDYIGNDKMYELRDNILQFYKDQGYLKGWTK